MSPLPTTFPGASDYLRREFGTKGGLPLSLDETIVPVAIVSDHETSPWASSRSVGRFAAHGPIVANFAGELIRPGAGTVLRVNLLSILNPTEALQTTFSVRIISAADIALTTLGTPTPLVDLQNPIDPTGAVARVGSTMTDIHHTALLGTIFNQNVLLTVGAGGFGSPVPLPNAVFLDGSARGGIGGLVVWNQGGTNLPIQVNVQGREFVHRA